MSDEESQDPQEDEKPFAIERAKQGRAGCKKCKQKCASGELRLAKIVPNPFGEGKMKSWYHVECMFEQFLKQRPATKRIESSDDVEGWDDLSDEDKETVQKLIDEYTKTICEKYNLKNSPKKAKTPKKGVTPNKIGTPNNVETSKKGETNEGACSNNGNVTKHTILMLNEDIPFREFRRLVADITNVSSYIDKTNIVKKMFTKGSDGKGFKGDITLWCRLLLPGVVKRIYNLQSKVLIKIFSKIFHADQETMLEHLEQGDIGETIQHFFEQSNGLRPSKKSNITISEVDNFLEELSKLTKQDEQTHHIKRVAAKCTSNDLKTIIRLIKHDLRMNAGAKHILEGVHPDAYEAYQACRDIKIVIARCLDGQASNADQSSSCQSSIGGQPSSSTKGAKVNKVKATISLMTPVLPMLAEACKSVEQAMKKCPNGMYSEIKYDGERVQVHKQGTEFRYYSRSLKPVMPHKIQYFKDYIPKAFPHGKDLILDCEILMVDTNTGKPLPFGTLGVHKKGEFKDASVCLFVFDCIYYNGEVLTHKPIQYRKEVLEENMTEIPNHVMFSEMKEIHKPEDLSAMIAKVLKLGLEGLVLKDLMSIYEPGKRHWLKVKKDYLFGGAMADSADLIVLGAWYGTGRKGGMMSVFLMGCYDKFRQKFCTVTKVHTGHDDKTLDRLQKELDMVKISGDASKVPSWLKCTKTMIPDFVAKDPKKQPVWEITGAEFTQQHDVHTADGISIRFPRVTKIRDDKDWEHATNLEELKLLFKNSKENMDVSLLTKAGSSSNMNFDEPSPKKKAKDSPKKESPVKERMSPKKERESPKKERESPKNERDSPTKLKLDNPREKATSKKVNEKRKRSDDIKGSIKTEKFNYHSDSTDIEDAEDYNIPKKIKLEDNIAESSMSNVSTSTSFSLANKIMKPLPDYFIGVNLLVEDGAEEIHAKWLRYFVAYGGTILKTEEWQTCSHVLHLKDYVKRPKIKCPPEARHITADWIRDSVHQKGLVNIRPYTVEIRVKHKGPVYCL